MYLSCNLQAKSLDHICQDAILQGHFVDSNRQPFLWLGAISDGCSEAIGSEYGSCYLVRQFGQAAQTAYKQGFRQIRLLDEVIIRLTNAMVNYQPRLEESEIFAYGRYEVSSELYATIYGYIADKDHVLLLLAGDGSIGLRNQIELIDNNYYPLLLLNYPQQEWRSKIDLIYTKVVIPRERFDHLLLATDGFAFTRQHCQLLSDPAGLINKLLTESTKPTFPCHRNDDSTAVILINSDPCMNPLPPEAAVRVKSETEAKGHDQISEDNGFCRRWAVRTAEPGFFEEYFTKKERLPVTTTDGVSALVPPELVSPPFAPPVEHTAPIAKIDVDETSTEKVDCKLVAVLPKPAITGNPESYCFWIRLSQKMTKLSDMLESFKSLYKRG